MPTAPADRAAAADAILEEIIAAGDVGGEPRRLVTATVASAGDVAEMTVTPPDAPEYTALLPRSRFYPGADLVVGDRHWLAEYPGDPPQLSAVDADIVPAVMAAFVPELRDGTIRVLGVARLPGVRAKVAVASTRDDVDPIAACVGKGANRRAAAVDRLAGERLDFIAWASDRAAYLANALAPATVSRVDIDGGDAVAYAPAHQMAAAVGSGGLNSQLAGQLTGLRVTVAEE